MIFYNSFSYSAQRHGSYTEIACDILKGNAANNVRLFLNKSHVAPLGRIIDGRDILPHVLVLPFEDRFKSLSFHSRYPANVVHHNLPIFFVQDVQDTRFNGLNGEGTGNSLSETFSARNH